LEFIAKKIFFMLIVDGGFFEGFMFLKELTFY